MKLRPGWLLSILTLATTLQAASPARDGGGRDVSVALFSTRKLRAVTITAIGPSSWFARCAQCKHDPFLQPLHVAGTMEVFAGGTLRVTDDGSGDSRTATGLWHVRGTSQHEVDVVLTLPSERYVAAVLNAEAARDEPAQSLRALAILARTYSLNGTHYSAQPGHLAADLCDSTQCQAMLPGPIGASIEDAVQATAGETLWFGSRRAQVFFSQSCGGLTEDAGATWPQLRGTPYLRTHADPYCLRRDSAAWHAEVPLTKFAEIAKTEGWHVPANPVAVRVTQRSGSHRALRVAFTGADAMTAEISASALRFGIGRTLGWDLVRSDAYDVGLRNGALIFDGHGHGHGVGLCQQGATEMATEGHNATEILAFYFPGTVIRILPADSGWQQKHIGALTLRTTQPLTTEREDALQNTWAEAQKRFPPKRAVAPEIVFAPTTEVFREMTTQPGWMLASTHGNTIILQPKTILFARWQDATPTLLHEMLHVLVESESSDHAPLWLREGLVEVLAGNLSGGTVPMAGANMSASSIDSALAHAGSRAESKQAHTAAAASVRALISRYGISAVRGWLVSGTPDGVT